MFTDEEIVLGKVALELAHAVDADHYRVVALRMLRDECGWTLLRADQVISHLLVVPSLVSGDKR